MKKIIAMTSAVLFVTLSSGLRAEESSSDCEKGYKWSEEQEKCVPMEKTTKTEEGKDGPKGDGGDND